MIPETSRPVREILHPASPPAGGKLMLVSGPSEWVWEGYIMTSAKLPRRQFLHLAAGTVALPALSRIARAQAYPTRPVRVIVPYAPGGPTDVFARLVSQKLTERLGKQFFVENIPGAGSNIGTG